MQIPRALQAALPRSLQHSVRLAMGLSLLLLIGGCSDLGLTTLAGEEPPPSGPEPEDEQNAPPQDEDPSDSEPGDEPSEGPDAPDDPGSDDDDEPSPEDPPVSAVDLCFSEIAAPPGEPAPNYEQFGPTIADHCNGTDHQDISGIERVVFLGDSVTVGTPPTADAEFYRSRLANQLVAEFGLEAPGPLWEAVNFFEGMSFVQDGGDFSSCAEWGARADDLFRDDDQ
ncbi:MAG: hypothetical protein VX498_08675, partial [Myxococcota bacterium]|nr:hypothetical protein [Myxococcota bacterium]